jgi:hypothetical protein
LNTLRLNYSFFNSTSIANLLLICVISSINIELCAQKIENLTFSKDSLKRSNDTITLKSASEDIKSKIVYDAEDSMIYDISSKKLYLYNQSKIDYTEMHIDAYYIEYDWTTGVMMANQKKITEDSVLGRPYMKQDGKDYYSHKIRYNFKSKQGKVYDIVTKDNDALLHGHEVKKDSIGNWFISKAKYTTCDLEHPHFYFNASKLKLTPSKTIITGPTNLVIADIQTPIYLPFGMYPTQSGRRSGIILPKEYGFTPLFNLQDMGFYLGINDHLDATILADIYFNGSYEFQTKVRYNKNYLYTGEFSAMTNRIFYGDPDNPSVKSSTPQNYLFTWTHSQSPKAHPTFNFNSSLTYMTQGAINQSLALDQRRITGQISSNLNITKRLRYKPLLINGGISYTQDLKTKTVSGQLPSLRINYNGNLFQNNENAKAMTVGFIYSSEAIAQFSNLADSQVFNGELFSKMNYGIKHSAVFNFNNIKLFKNINFIPNLSYNDRFYFKKININRPLGEKRIDTSYDNGFYSVRDFNGGVSMNTVLIGIYRTGKHGIIQGLKHQMSPSVNFTFNPNFGTDFWGYYGKYNDTLNKEVKYDQYKGPYGYANQFASAFINFGINNALEGKFRNKKDSISGVKKMMLLDAFNFSSSYNILADSFNLSNFNLGFSNSTLRFLTFSGSINFDPYSYDNTVRKDKFKLFNNDGLLRWKDINVSASFNLGSSNFSKKILETDKGSEYERNFIYKNYHYFYDFNSPWNISMSFNMNINRYFSPLTRRDTSQLSASIILNNFDYNLTKNWKIGISSGYDFNTKSLGITQISAIRNMHCWEFRVNYTPISNIGQAYSIEIRPKSALLQDLKLSRNKPAIQNYF